jgi:hypothetical protein
VSFEGLKEMSLTANFVNCRSCRSMKARNALNREIGSQGSDFISMCTECGRRMLRLY